METDAQCFDFCGDSLDSVLLDGSYRCRYLFDGEPGWYGDCHRFAADRSSFAVVPTDVSIGMTAYLVTLTVFIPISGWIADRFGARTIFGTANRHFHFGFGRLRTCE